MDAHAAGPCRRERRADEAMAAFESLCAERFDKENWVIVGGIIHAAAN